MEILYAIIGIMILFVVLSVLFNLFMYLLPFILIFMVIAYFYYKYNEHKRKKYYEDLEQPYNEEEMEVDDTMDIIDADFTEKKDEE